MNPGDVSIGPYLVDVETTLADLGRRNVVGRIWRKDHTVWKPDPTEISNRLGWLKVSDLMRKQAPELKAFAKKIREADFRHMVLLGMGGSSLGAEVLRQVFGSAEGYPELIVLDSTLPASVQSVATLIDPAKTLFMVSSKSGTTAEPLALFNHFRSLVESAVGKGEIGQNFVAITDPGTPLAGLAQNEGFRHTFLNLSDIGGRYSVLSYFGLVPAALIGIDITALLKRADVMQEGCESSVPVRENPGAWLGACIGTLALKGRDKLTIVTSPSINSFGLWVEQLIAESTGKEGTGIIPVVGEPLVEPKHYGDDRLFIYLRLENDDNSTTDAAVERIRSAGQPVVILRMRDEHDLGTEFFRWEFATAVAGAILGIHPFDQPNVQQAKDVTEALLQKYIKSGRLPQAEPPGSLSDLLAKAEKDKYLAIMAYVAQTPETDAALADLRQKVVEHYHIATTLGYGPRFLHSTGQLHKGGPNKGLFIQVTTDYKTDFPIPGKPYTFGVIADAQALGDYQALKSLGRYIIKVHFSRGDEAAIAKLLATLWKQFEPIQ
ncbi:glucose-6-phosphate isomerase [Chloroflexota bacterium]